MSILHYFSQDVNKRGKFIFNLIAPIYGRVNDTLVKNYSNSISLLDSEISIAGKSVLDIGTGTGAWAAMFFNKKAKYVHGVDFSDNMLNESRRRHPEIRFSIGNAEDLHEFSDNSFDIVTASYVAHGVKADRRSVMLSEMKRVSVEYVIINDFFGKTPIFGRFLEFIERSDYKNFKINFCDELKEVFSEVKKIPSVSGSGLYIAKI